MAAIETPLAWTSKTISLRCSLSYVRLFNLNFRALEIPHPFDPNRRPLTELHPPVEEVLIGFDVVVDRHQVLPGQLPTIQSLPNLLCYAPRQLLHFYTDLTGGAEKAFKSMSAKTRSTIQRKVRSFRDFCGGTIPWRVYSTPAEMREFHGYAREVARKTYQERLFDAGLPETVAFQEHMLHLAGRGLARGFVLFHNAKPVAYLYTPAPDGFLIYDYLGYDPSYADRSPGTVLQYVVLEYLYSEQRFPMYYWGYGYSQTKQIFSTGQVLAADLFYFRPTVRNRAAVRLHYSIDHVAERVGNVLQSLKVKETIKRRLKGQ